MTTPRRVGQTPRLALIGCGAIAACYHLPALAKISVTQDPQVIEQLTLVDPNLAQAQTLADTFGITRVAPDYHRIVSELDGAIVAVPPKLHYPITMDLLRHGVHVLCEKPLAPTLAEARDMVAQALRSGVTLSVNQTRRLFPGHEQVRELMATGAIGEPLSMSYIDGEAFCWPTVSGFYFKSGADAPRGVLLDRGVHVLDAVCWWLGGEPTALSCQTDSFGGPEAVVRLTFSHQQCRGEVRLSSLNKLCNTYRVEGESGVLSGGIEDWSHVTLLRWADRLR